MRKLTTTFAAAAVLAASTPAMAYSYAETLHDKVIQCLAMGGTVTDTSSRRVGANRYVPLVECTMADGSVRHF
jgi:hypothetical protein